jgi:hypothetical protein
MQQPDGRRPKWVQTEAAKHDTPESIRRRIADEQRQIRILSGAGLTNETIRTALEAHHELIRVRNASRISDKCFYRIG